MTFREEKMDLFTVDATYYLAHCIASDIRMGAGIAVPMNEKFDLRRRLLEKVKLGESLRHPTCILTGEVFNLITKAKSYEKPTFSNLVVAVEMMAAIAKQRGFIRIAMPRIGCGLDRLPWGAVRDALKKAFEDTDMEILVCVWP